MNTTPILLATLFAAATVTSTASAQDAGGPPPDTPMKSDLELVLGGGVAYQPTYIGADEQKARPIPLISARWKSGFFAGVTGVGYQLSPVKDLSLGILVGLSPGRDQDDSEALRGMGDIKTRPEFGVSASYRLMPMFSIGSSLRYGSGNDRDGLLADISVRAMLPLAGPTHRLMAGVTATYANEASMRSHFGVTQAQSASSRYAVYSPGAGIREVSAHLGYAHSLTPSAMVTLGVTGRALQGDAKDSPLTKKANAVGANLVFAYRF